MTNYNFTLNNLNDNILDIRDIIEYYENLDEECQDELEQKEFIKENILNELRGAGGDEEWQGDWYPLTLIAENSWLDYVKEYAEDCCGVTQSCSWPYNHIDWSAAANELLIDYCELDINYNGRNYTFYYR